MTDRLPEPLTLVERLHQIAYLLWEVPLSVFPRSPFLQDKSIAALTRAIRERMAVVERQQVYKDYFSD